MIRDELLDWLHDPKNIKKYPALQDFVLMEDTGVDFWCIFQPAGAYESLVLYVKTDDISMDFIGKRIIEELRRNKYHGGYLDSYAYAKKYLTEWAEIINRQNKRKRA